MGKEIIFEVIEVIILISVLIELLILVWKIIRRDEGKPLLVLIMLSTVAIRDFLLMSEGVKEASTYIMTLDATIVVVVFIIVNTKKIIERRILDKLDSKSLEDG